MRRGISVREAADRRWRSRADETLTGAPNEREVRFGRPRRKMPPEFAEAVEMVRCGEISGREAAQLCGMSHSTFREWMRKCKAEEDEK